MSFITIILRKNDLNSKKEEPLEINIQDNFGSVLSSICNKLNIKAKMIFNDNGTQIEDVKYIHENNNIYVSEGESFCRLSKSKSVSGPVNSGTRMYIGIRKNGARPDEEKRFVFNTNENFQDILARIGKKLGIEAKILFNENGRKIKDPTDILDGEAIYASQGERFCAVENKKKTKKIIKLCLLGASSIGRSVFVTRYVRNYFQSEYTPSIEEMYKKSIWIENQIVGLDILDTTGMEEFVVMRPCWYDNYESFLMMYSINSRESFHIIKERYKEMKKYMPEAFDQPPPKKGKPDRSITIVVVGCKSDLESQREVSKEEGMELAKSWNAPFFETSAKTNTNVNIVFETIAKMTYKKKYPKIDDGCTLF